MGATNVNPVNGKYTIPGANNRNVELTLDASNLQNYIVESLDGTDLNAKLPSSNPNNINWFACFSVSNRGGKRGSATVQYSFTVALDPGQKLYVAYNNGAHDVTRPIQNGKVTVSLNQGDPVIGSVP
jgi:hypothetical protein